ncbi:MAG: hypothetical protein EOP35_25015, partial [Rubrivivax sp.]
MTDQLDHDLARLRDAHARVAGASPHVVAAARARLLGVSPSSVQSSRNAPAARFALGRRSVRRPLLFACAAGLAVATLAVFTVLPDRAAERLPGGADLGLAAAAERSCSTPATSRSASAACLNALGAVAGDWQVPGHGNVLYQRSWWSTSARHMGPGTEDGHGRDGDPGFYMITRGAEKEVWLAPNGSGESLQLDEGAPQLPSAADRAAWIADGSPPLERPAPTQSTAGTSGAAWDAEQRAARQPPGERRLTGAEISLGQARLRWKAGDAPPDLFPVGEIHGPNGERALLRTGDPVREFSSEPRRLRTQVLDFAWRQRIELSGDARCAKDLHDCLPGVRRNITSNFAYISLALLQYPATTRPLRAAVLQ